MTWSRRQFLTGVGVLAAVSGTAGRVVAKTLNINGVRYGMVHDESLCIGCTACARSCPVEAISGVVKQTHHIDPNKCVKCRKASRA